MVKELTTRKSEEELYRDIIKISDELIHLSEKTNLQEQEIEKERKDLHEKFREQEKELIEQEQLIVTQEIELTKLRKDKEFIDIREKLIAELGEKLKQRDEYLRKLEEKHKAVLQSHNEFTHSIVYPLYSITHFVGKTKLGEIIQSIVKK